MKRGLFTISLSVVFLLNAFQLHEARAGTDAYSGDHLTSLSASQVSAESESRGDNQLRTEFKRPTRLAGEPKWVTSNIVPNLKRRQRGRFRKAAAVRDDRIAYPFLGKSPGRTPTKRSRDAALFMRREAVMQHSYERLTGRSLYITDRYRTPRKQALRIISTIRRFGFSYVVVLYRSRPAIREIVRVYKLNRRSRKLVPAMTRTIESQVRSGIFISNHMRWRAIDVRSKGRNGARLSALRQVARSMGARVSVERNHFHVDLP